MDIDLNADLGEGLGPWRMGDDEALLGIVSSANVACGFHAGDPLIMDRTVRTALGNGVDVGAHVGFPDLVGFGRRQMQMEPAELSACVLYQLAALSGMVAASSTPPRSCDPSRRSSRTTWYSWTWKKVRASCAASRASNPRPCASA